ncbi:MAG: aminotransferase class III-fold pyridoxal phosphate-dependent enzyme [Chloroflexi bacterium]|nr:aminotransferase class III-fold pyridoxal phosphate-dependent enzyme [Chloroflexota bacterium]MCI0869214.1 aminotransferase class III-fold pyridoxal phosphate-dependent enzyme [Chloroflexota bacterium]
MVTPIEQRYIDLHPGSAERHAKARELFPDGVTHDARRLKPFQLYYTHAEGAAKYDVDDNRILDFFPGHGALMLGHSHPDIVAAVQDQMAKGTHFSGSTDLEIQWGELVTELIPSAEKVRFHSSGTEADMMAIRMARAYTGKSKIIMFEHHFHGWSDYLVAGSEGIGGIPEETLSTMIVLPPSNISIVEKALQENDDIAGIILEPTGAHMGLEPILPSFLNELRDVTQRYDVVLIFDEVVTGFRTSRGGAQAYYGVTPDLTTMAKILGGGLPGGAVAGKTDIINMIQATDDPEFNRNRRIAHNGTFNANPLAAAAGVKMLQIVRDEPINETADARAQQLKDGLNDLLGHQEIPGCVSGVASLQFLRLGVDHDCDKEICILSREDMKKSQDAVRNHQLTLSLLNHGVQAGVRFILTAAHSEDDIQFTIDAYGKAFAELREVGLL